MNVVRPLTVVADSKVSELSLKETTINVSDKVNQTVDVVINDQYGDKITTSQTVKAEIKSGSNILGLDVTSKTTSNGTATFEIQPKVDQAGTATIEFAIGDVKTTLTVNVAKAGEIDSYELEGLETKLDIFATNKAETPQAMTLKVFGVDANGVKVGNALDANAGDYTVELTGKDKDGNDIAQGTVDGYLVTTSGDAVITPLTVGTYTAKVKVGTLTVATETFEVVDTEPAPIVTQTTSTIKAKGNVGEDIFAALKAALKLTIDGKDVAITNLDGITFVSDNTAVVNSETDGTSVLTLSEGTATLAITKVKISTGAPSSLSNEVIDVNLLVNVTVADETAPVATKGSTDTANKLDLDFDEDVKSVVINTGAKTTVADATVDFDADVDATVAALESSTGAADGEKINFTITDVAGNSKTYTASFATVGNWTVTAD